MYPQRTSRIYQLKPLIAVTAANTLIFGFDSNNTSILTSTGATDAGF
jgi:hypothetical protein